MAANATNSGPLIHRRRAARALARHPRASARITQPGDRRSILAADGARATHPLTIPELGWSACPLATDRVPAVAADGLPTEVVATGPVAAVATATVSGLFWVAIESVPVSPAGASVWVVAAGRTGGDPAGVGRWWRGWRRFSGFIAAALHPAPCPGRCYGWCRAACGRRGRRR
ncbi:hypothetical protein GCM10023321_63820 [Pseudonocardia eucalypti]|uniref:Uncharacterized protein n=1 Tax=Pseudonocardia eucalypti TaxID=648755 RepID=A0ABP9QXB1_9PSEU